MVRFKNRYILGDIVFPDIRTQHAAASCLNEKSVYQAVRSALLKAHGDYGMARVMSLSVKYLNPKTNIVLIRVQRGAQQLVQSAVVFIRKIGEQEAFFRTLHVGGTIRSCQKFLLRHHKEQLSPFMRQCKSEEERKEFHTAVVDACAKMDGDTLKS